MTGPLAGKRALVTGASGAIGSAIARRLARDGATVLLHGFSRPDAVQQLAAEIGDAGGSAGSWIFDLTDEAASRQACEQLLLGGPVQIVVNNAGIHDDAVFPGMRAAQWHRVIDVSLNGFFNVTQPLLLPMLRTRWGRVINISSVAGLIGNRGQVNYAAAKGAINSATKALSLEVASRGVTVNAIAPGIIASPMADAAFDAETIGRIVPVKRAGTADEVAALAGFLAGPEAGYITGQVISVNGGMC
ncbi:3-oxoacyl-ACP reductase FabG [Piscinibacter sakaiensis]|uniref:3-oxoacyl-ACP reductase FabG n=1 Tax=Piscinibacter sakaiensis TaxID=1547922 RepID=UPI003AAA9122